MRRGHLAALGAAFSAVALFATTAPATAGPGLLVGAVEEDVRAPSLVQAQAKMSLFRLAGFRAVRVTSFWTPGATAPDAEELRVLESVAGAARMSGVRVFVTVMHPGSRTTPLTEEAQAQFAAYAAALVRSVAGIRDLIVANEPNLNRFWLPQFGADGANVAAPAYLGLLARTYDAVKAVDPATNVHGVAVSPRGSDRPGGIRHTHSPTKFIRDLGTAYRASGRGRPIMDTFVIHPYMDNSSVPPTFAHPLTTTIGIADYDKLIALLGEAFDGTAQRGSTLPILYGEFGVESQIPAAKAGLYTGNEPATTRPVSEATQAAYYRQALAMAFCQPNVMGMLLLHSQDERPLDRWQSGVYYVDGSPKASLPQVTEALDRTAGGSIARCPGIQLVVRAGFLRLGTRSQARLGIFGARFRCSLDCVYELRLVKVGGVTKMVRRGRAEVDQQVEVEFAPRRLARGSYRYRLKLVHPINPGPPTVRLGPTFRLP